MAHFYATARGNRGDTHRCGSKKSGAYVEVKGWQDGVTVYAYWDEDRKTNLYRICLKVKGVDKEVVIAYGDGTIKIIK